LLLNVLFIAFSDMVVFFCYFVLVLLIVVGHLRTAEVE
jgi:hypothetical protein